MIHPEESEEMEKQLRSKVARAINNHAHFENAAVEAKEIYGIDL